MSYRLLINDIKSNNIKNVNILFGTERYLIDKALESLKSSIVTAFPELNYSLLDGAQVKADNLIVACETFPFACERKLVIVRDLPVFKAAKGEDAGESSISPDLNSYIQLISNVTDTTCLVFVFYGNIDKRKKIFTEIKKNGSIYEFNRVERDEFATWIKNVLNKANKKINPRELENFIHATGYLDKNSSKTLYDIENDIKKLISYTGKEANISVEHINAVMPRNIENDIFKLINACSERKVSESLRVYGDMLVEGESSLGVLAMISRQVKNIINVQELNSKRYDSKSIADKLKIHEFTVKLCTKYCQTISRSKLVNAFNKCLDAEMCIKSGKMAERLALEMLLVSLFE